MRSTLRFTLLFFVIALASAFAGLIGTTAAGAAFAKVTCFVFFAFAMASLMGGLSALKRR